MDFASEVDVIRMDRILELIPTECWEWDGAGKITLNDISIALNNGVADTSQPYGDTYKYPVSKKRNRDYHISRILFFVKHKDQIKELDVDNMCAAATWLYKKGELDKISCKYGGRKDVLQYLCGEIDELPLD